MRRVLAGHNKFGTAFFPVANTTSVRIIFSTKVGDSVITLGDGSSPTSETNLKYQDFTTYVSSPSLIKTYSSAFTGNTAIKFLNGLKDVYSWYYISGGSSEGSGANITNLESFLAQFQNLYSLQINVGVNVLPAIHRIAGDWAKIPINLEKIKLTNIEGVANVSTDLILNVNNYPIGSKLKYFSCLTSIKLNGDLNKIPTTCPFFYINSVYAGSSITYTAGKVWANNLETLSIPLSLTTSELDNLLIDMQNSITSTGAGTIALSGWRSVASDAAVAYLQGLGRTVDIIRNTYGKSVLYDSSTILRMDFQNNYDVHSNTLIDITSGNGVGSTGNLPTFALSGRKAGEYCAVFNGSQSIKTTTNLPINSDKVTIAFWIKTTQTILGLVTELSTNYTNNCFGVQINNAVANKIEIYNNKTGLNLGNSISNINSGSWISVVITVDRTGGVNQNKIYINGSLSYAQYSSLSTNNTGNFVNNILFIGQRGGSSSGFNGSLTKLKIYNYSFTATEVSTLYNSEL